MLSTFFRQLSQLFHWIILVAPWEQALRIRLGRKVTQLKSGWYWRIPFIDRVYRQSIRRRLTPIGSMTLMTTDRQTITLSGFVGYEIKDLVLLYNSLHQPDGTIQAVCNAKIADFVVIRRLQDINLIELQETVCKLLCLEQYGLGNISVSITNFVSVRTLRIIMGGVEPWFQGYSCVRTDLEERQALTVPV